MRRTLYESLQLLALRIRQSGSSHIDDSQRLFSPESVGECGSADLLLFRCRVAAVPTRCVPKELGNSVDLSARLSS